VSRVGTPTERVPGSAAAVFGPRLELAERYAGLLVSDGVRRGVIGPREPERIWTRHLLNCAPVSDLFPEQSRVVDVGSGAGLPGIALAVRRPDLRVDLVEPLLRRVDFLHEIVTDLGLGEQVRVLRGRADDASIRSAVGNTAWVTARAVAPLDRLVRWCLPLLATDGRLALLKGVSAADEVERHRAALTRAGAVDVTIVRCGSELGVPEVTVVTLGRGPSPARVRPVGRRGGR
jgi:16S rRNA (guanine527-N7)-methyltransferase